MTGSGTPNPRPTRSVSLSRRGFIEMGALGAGSAAVLALGYSLASGQFQSFLKLISNRPISPFERLASMDRNAFTEQLGERFQLTVAGSTQGNLELIDITNPAPGLMPKAQKQSLAEGEVFSLIFRGSDDHFLTQDMYDLSNSTVGEFPLFIVPLQTAGGHTYYEAIIDRRHSG